MSYATVDELRSWAEFYGVSLPGFEECERLLDLATRDVQRYLGARPEIPLPEPEEIEALGEEIPLLEPEQIEALRDATAVQACFRAGQGGDFALGLDDGLSAIGGLSFSTRTPPRFSTEAAELLAGLGLYLRSGTVPLEDADTA